MPGRDVRGRIVQRFYNARGVELNYLLDRDGALVWSKTGWPQIRSFGAAPAWVDSDSSAVASITVGWNVRGAARVRVTQDGVQRYDNPNSPPNNVDNVSGLATPARDSVFRLEATNQEGTVTATAVFYRTESPVISAYAATYLGPHIQPGGHLLLQWRLRGTVAMHPWAGGATTVAVAPDNPTLGPSNHAIQRALDRQTGTSRSFDVGVSRTTSGTARPPETFTLTARNPISGERTTRSVTVQE